MTGAAPDREVRRLALAPHRSFVVRAPAGSGKTALLIQRYLALLARARRPEEVVAITFTVKAAAEMRARILAALEGAGGPAPREAHARETWELGRAALERDRERGWQIARNPSRLPIQTIDALCASLVRRMPWHSRLGASIGLVEDAAAHYREAAREVFRLFQADDPDWREAIARVLAHLDNDVPRLERLLAQMLARRDQWLRHVSPAPGEEGGRRRQEAALERLLADELAALRAAVPDALAEDILAAAGAPGGDFPAASAQSLPQWRALADTLLTKAGKPRARFPALRSVALAAHPDFVRRLHAVRSLPDAEIGARQWEVLGALYSVLRLAAGCLRLVFQEREEMDFIELLGSASSALGEAEQPTDLGLALDYRISHLLVDEFQDTSHAQVALLERLTAGWEPGDGRTVFLVGDPAQSIYRFREADVGLYLRVRDHGLGGVALTPLTLEANFRSRAPLVEWLNRAFPRVLAEAEDVSTGAVTYSACAAMRGDAGGGVLVHRLLDDDGAGEARRVLDIVAERRAEDARASIAILVRSRSHLARILSQLRAARVPFRGVEIDALGAMSVIQDLLSLTRALARLADRIAWIAVLRAPWCGLTLADLAALCDPGDRDRVIWDALNDPERLRRLSEDGQARVARVREALGGALQARSRSALRRRVEHAWLSLGGAACVSAADLARVDAFLALIDETAAGTECDLERLAAVIGERYAAASDAEARVEVMTIHNAKGLEFDTVIVPGLDRGAPPDERAILEWTERVHGSGQDLLIAPLSARGAPPEPVYEHLRALEATKLDHELGRLLYVAATRARERLHLICPLSRAERGGLRPPRKGTLLHKLWPALGAELEEEAPREPEQLALDDGPPAPCLYRLPRAFSLPAAPPAALGPSRTAPEPHEPVLFAWAGASAKPVGIVVHRMLRTMAEEGPARWSLERLAGRRSQWQRALASLGVPPEEIEGAAERVQRALLAVLDDPRARWLLDPAREDAHSEYALSGLIGGRVVNVVLDRTFVADGVRWIVDYKTGAHEGASLDEFLDRERGRYAPQLETYGALLGAREPRPVRLGLYFPLHRGWREWPAPGAGRAPCR